jgi:hypothetical protein
MAYAAFLAAMLGLVRYNSNAVATHSQAFADVVSRYDLPGFWSGAAVFYQAWAQGADGAEDLRLAEMRRGLAIYREQGRFWLVPSLEAALAEAEAGSGETDAALRRLDDAIGALNGTESRLYEAEMHRVRASILAPLAFVSPQVVAAIIDGTAPADLTITGLAKALPYSWAEQERRIRLHASTSSGFLVTDTDR